MKFFGKILSFLAIFGMVFNVALATPQNQITICHLPPGNPGNAQTIEIDANDWPAHEAHGDYQGECQTGGNGDPEPGLDPEVCDPNINLISNGGFESPEVVNASGWQLFDDGATDVDWDVSWNGSFVGAPATAKIELHGGVNGWLPYEGEQYTELDSDWGYNNNEEASVDLSQTISTENGVEYVLGYAFSPRPNTVAGDNILEVLVNGNVVATHGPVAGLGNTSWTYYTYNFVADDSSAEISFRDAGNPNSLGTFLDAVSVNCIEGCDSNGPLYARINIKDNAAKWRNWNEDEMTGNPMALNVYVGGDQEENRYDVFEWFPLVDENGDFINDPDISGYEDVPGLAVQREEGSIRVVLHGSHEQPEVNDMYFRELAAGSIELSTDMFTRLTGAWDKENEFKDPMNTYTRVHDATVNDPENPMDSRGNFKGYIHQYNPRFDNVRVFVDLFQFHLVVTTGDDGFYARYDADVVSNDCQIDPQ